MQSLKKLLPSASALVVFEAAGRHENFSRAADELSMTQAAVSYAVRTLETQLGVPLFNRSHRAVALTETASLLLTPGRRCQNGKLAPVDRADWKQYVAALVDVGKLAYRTSRARDFEAFGGVSEKLNEACDNCHKVYRDKGGPEGSGTARCQ